MDFKKVNCVALSTGFMVVEAPGHTCVVVALSATNNEIKQWFSTFFTDGTLNSYIVFCDTPIQFSICIIA